MSATRGALALCTLLAAACAEAERAPAFEHRPVVAQTIARLEAEVAAARPSTAAPAELDPERVPGLVHLLAASRGRERELALEEVQQLGDAAVPALAVIAAGERAARRGAHRGLRAPRDGGRRARRLAPRRPDRESARALVARASGVAHRSSGSRRAGARACCCG